MIADFNRVLMRIHRLIFFKDLRAQLDAAQKTIRHQQIALAAARTIPETPLTDPPPRVSHRAFLT
jgi:hypothetical protein